MNQVKKACLLLAIGSMVLSACGAERKIFCLDTFNQVDYESGMCAQMSKNDINEVVYVFCLPNNPEADASEYQYEITWNKVTNKNYFSFVQGLEGKKADSVIVLEKNTLKINVHGLNRDQEATYGYLRISQEAFTANSENSRNAFAYAYFAIGEQSGAVAKPEDITFA